MESIKNNLLIKQLTNDSNLDKTSKIIDISKETINNGISNIHNIQNPNRNKNHKIDLRIMNKNDYELNILQYEDALKIDKRTYIEYYFSLLKINHPLFFPFRSDDYNSFIIKIYLFFFSFILYFAINTLFFSDSTMHKIYEDSGSFNFIYQIPQIIYSSLISSVVHALIRTLSLSEKNILEIKQEKLVNNLDKKANEIIKCLYIKFRLFFSISFILILFFWYYISCFCAVYKNTQIHLIKDTLISFGTSMFYPLGIYLIPGIFRIIALKGKDKELIFNLGKLLQMI